MRLLRGESTLVHRKLAGGVMFSFSDRTWTQTERVTNTKRKQMELEPLRRNANIHTANEEKKKER
jgi:hypothetical protein